MSLCVAIKRTENNLFANFPNAVGRIEKIDTRNNSINIEVGFYADEEARNLIKNTDKQQMPMNNYLIKQRNYTFDMSDINELDFSKDGLSVEDVLKTACYIMLKTLSDFENATDI